MTIYLISSNLLVDNIKYQDNDIDTVRSLRPLSISGEDKIKELSNNLEFMDIEAIYSSLYSSAIDGAKYLAEKYDVAINLDERLNDCKVGALGSKSMKMLKGIQEHDFNYKLPEGESLNQVGLRMNYIINEIVKADSHAIIFTHRRSILGYLIRYSSIGYNLDDELILEFNKKTVFSNSENAVDIYKLTFVNKKLDDIDLI